MNNKPNFSDACGHLTITVFTLAFAVFCFSSSCKIGYATPGGFGVAEYLPYVKEVTIPDKIREGEAFKVDLEVSADRFPDALKEYFLESALPLKPNSAGIIRLTTWVRVVGIVKPSKTSVSYYIDGLAKGEYMLEIPTADSAEWGGLGVSYEYGNGIPAINGDWQGSSLRPNHEHATYLLIPITVLPPEGS